MSSKNQQSIISWTSILLSGIMLIVYIVLKVKLELRLASESGKTLAFPGLQELMCFYSSWWPLALGSGAMGLSIHASKLKEDSKMVVVAFLASFFMLILWYWPFLGLLFCS